MLLSVEYIKRFENRNFELSAARTSIRIEIRVTCVAQNLNQDVLHTKKCSRSRVSRVSHNVNIFGLSLPYIGLRNEIPLSLCLVAVKRYDKNKKSSPHFAILNFLPLAVML